MRRLALLLLLAAPLALAQPVQLDEEAQRKTIAEGIVLFDAGKYDEAIVKYKTVLASNPRNINAVHELGLAYTAKSQFAECRDLLRPFVKNGGVAEITLFDTLGNCFDGLGKPDEAMKVYRRGLQLSPNHPQLSFNLAITLGQLGKLDEARELLKTDLRQRPGHASGHYYLGLIFRQQGFSVPAAVELLRFLSLEPTSPRSKGAATAVLELMNLGVTQKDEKNIELKMDPNARKEEGDFSGVQLGWSLAAAARFTEKTEKMSEFEKLIDQVGGSIGMLVEIPNKPAGSFVAQTELPFFTELYEAKRIDPFVAIAFSSLKLSGQEAWMKEHQEELEKTFDHLMKQEKLSPIPMPQP